MPAAATGSDVIRYTESKPIWRLLHDFVSGICRCITGEPLWMSIGIIES
jgi:hypothetical protein